MPKSLLITRPDDDPLLNALFHWCKPIILEAQKKQFSIYDLSGNKAIKTKFDSYVSRNNPKLIFFNGHGSKDSIHGYNKEVLIDSTDCIQLLRGTIVYVRSCNVGASMGQISTKSGGGAVAFIGYSAKFWLILSKSRNTLPLLDPVAKFFLETSNLVPLSLIKGNSVEEADKKSRDAMLRSYLFMNSSKATTEQRQAAGFLYLNRLFQVVHGDKTARLY
ncbi:hypothetical protein KKE78_01615 [Patescibacteria group bacterium]|nr:hypothetical protein [Patescibacteria group bacterium]